MTQRYAAAAVEATGHPGCVIGEGRTHVRIGEIVSRVARARWPRKTAAELASRTDVSVRTAEYWLAGRCGLSAEALADLLCSDAGLVTLEEIMERRHTKPAWWSAFRRHQKRADIRRQLKELQHRLDEVDGDE